jgi:hypothetical protein
MLTGVSDGVDHRLDVGVRAKAGRDALGAGFAYAVSRRMVSQDPDVRR